MAEMMAEHHLTPHVLWRRVRHEPSGGELVGRGGNLDGHALRDAQLLHKGKRISHRASVGCRSAALHLADQLRGELDRVGDPKVVEIQERERVRLRGAALARAGGVREGVREGGAL